MSILMTFDVKHSRDLCRVIFEPDNYPSELLAVTKTNTPPLNTVMCGYLLPENLIWPFFFGTKQDKAESQNMLYHRLSGTHPALYQECFRVVNEDGDQGIIVGVPGIGKSADMNYLLLQYVAHLGEEGWKNRVFVRIGNILTEMYIDGDSETLGTVKCRFYDLPSLDMLRYLGNRKDTVLLLELAERDSDPDVDCPMISSTSCTSDTQVFKALDKSHSASFLLAEPHSVTEAACEVLLANAASRSKEPVFDLAEVLVRHNLDPRPREYFSSYLQGRYKDIPTLLSRSAEFGVLYMPEYASQYMSPYVAPGVLIPHAELKRIPKKQLVNCQTDWFKLRGPRHHYRFYNEVIAAEAAKKVMKPSDLGAIRSMGMMWQIQEVHVLYGGLLRASQQQPLDRQRQMSMPEIDEKYLDKHWEWYRDCGPHLTLTQGQEIEHKSKPSLKHCVGIIQFSSTYIRCAAWELTPDRVYYSTPHTSWVHSFLFISSSDYLRRSTGASSRTSGRGDVIASASDSASTSTSTSTTVSGNNNKMTLYMIHVTEKVPQDHVIKMATLSTVFEKMQLSKEHAEAAKRIAKVVFVHIVSKTCAMSSMKGITIEESIKKEALVLSEGIIEETVETIKLSWAEASAKLLSEGIAAEAYIVRAKTMP